MAWVLLVLAIVAEVVGTLSLKASDGFSRLWPSVAVVVAYALAFTLLAFTLKTLEHIASIAFAPLHCSAVENQLTVTMT